MSQKDLVILVADNNIKFSLIGLMERASDLQISNINFEIFRHPNSDPGCLRSSHEFLRSSQHTYRYALVIFDKQGCGRENKSREELEKSVNDNLERCGWKDRCDTIIIDPELEAWIWNNKYEEIEKVIGWQKQTSLDKFLINKEYINQNSIKPKDPKKAFEEILSYIRKPRSSSFYKDLANVLSFKGCQDLSFQKLLNTLKKWFPAK